MDHLMDMSVPVPLDTLLGIASCVGFLIAFALVISGMAPGGKAKWSRVVVGALLGMGSFGLASAADNIIAERNAMKVLEKFPEWRQLYIDLKELDDDFGTPLKNARIEAFLSSNPPKVSKEIYTVFQDVLPYVYARSQIAKFVDFNLQSIE